MAVGLKQLEMAQSVELVAAELYRLLAAKFVSGGPIATTFENLAKEEDQHALRIQMLRSQVSRRPMDFRQDLDLSNIEALLEEAHMLRELFAQDAFRPTTAEAKRFMIELENRFYEAHAQVIVTMENEDLRGFFRSLAEQDRAHAKLLQQLLEDS